MADSPDSNAYRAMGLASEAIAAVRSHESLVNLQFKSMNEKYEEIRTSLEEKHKENRLSMTEIKNTIDATCTEMREGFKSYDNRFWGLALLFIAALIGALGTLTFYLLTHR